MSYSTWRAPTSTPTWQPPTSSPRDRHAGAIRSLLRLCLTQESRRALVVLLVTLEHERRRDVLPGQVAEQVTAVTLQLGGLGPEAIDRALRQLDNGQVGPCGCPPAAARPSLVNLLNACHATADVLPGRVVTAYEEARDVLNRQVCTVTTP